MNVILNFIIMIYSIIIKIFETININLAALDELVDWFADCFLFSFAIFFSYEFFLSVHIKPIVFENKVESMPGRLLVIAAIIIKILFKYYINI
jgi:hypothetical protein